MRSFFAKAIFVFILFCSCNNSKKENTAKENEEQFVSQNLDNSFTSAFRFFKEQDSSFSVDRFENSGEQPMDSLPPLPADEKELKPYYPYFIYNSDSSLAIDLYSYNVLFVNKKGKLVTEGAGPDTEVGLIDSRKRTRQRVYFGGSSNAVIDANWISNHEFFLLTGEITGDKKLQPLILKFDLNTKMKQYYQYPDTLSVKASDYKDERLPVN